MPLANIHKTHYEPMHTRRFHHNISSLLNCVDSTVSWLSLLTSIPIVHCFWLVIQWPHWPSRLELENIPTASLQRGKTPPTSVLDMALNNLMLELWGCGVPFFCHHSQVHCGLEFKHMIPMDQVELNCVLMLNWIIWNRTVWHLTVCK